MELSEVMKNRMKKILTNTITLFAEITALILGILWFIKTKEHEPLIVIVLSISTIITSWILKSEESSNVEISVIPDGKGKGHTQHSLKTPKNVEGIPIAQLGDIVGKREVYWQYIIKITNNSSITAFKPELYVTKEFKSLNFIGNLDVNSPIKGTESVDLEIKFTKWTDGTPIERERDFEHEYPPEILKGLKMIIKYSSENGSFVYKKFEFEDKFQTNKKVQKLSTEFEKVKIYPPILRQI
jgi:hypothetical protein